MRQEIERGSVILQKNTAACDNRSEAREIAKKKGFICGTVNRTMDVSIERETEGERWTSAI